MTAWTQFADQMLLALHRYSQLNPGRPVPPSDLAASIGMDWVDGFASRLAEEWEQDGLATSSEAMESGPWFVISAKGAGEAERRTTLNPSYLLSERINSADWTGISVRLNASPELVEQIRLKIREVDALVEASHLTNEERVKAKSISAALIALVESPEPEWKAIVELLSSKPMSALMNATRIIGWIVTAVFALFGSR